MKDPHIYMTGTPPEAASPPATGLGEPLSDDERVLMLLGFLRSSDPGAWSYDAADLIEELTAENARLRKVLAPWRTALTALESYEADYGEPLDEMHELGRIEESRSSSSFRIRVGHVRRLARAALGDRT
jgi:hypothetical protein